jgi:predicted Zn-ribbon and HTH transcriptional regulator
LGSIKQVSIVLAKYCPHCLPFSLRNAERMAEDFGVPLRVLDIEIPEQEAAADRLVEEYGDWSEDYLIPQVFVEYEDGRVGHVLTGFSEAVSATEAAWDALFSSDYYQTRRKERITAERKPLKEFVETSLSFKGRCRRHCDSPTSLVPVWSDAENLVGAYVCPSAYVSRVIYFSVKPDIDRFRGFLTTQVGEEIVNDRDIRPATRHGWELRNDAVAEICEVSPNSRVQEIYWTIYPRTEIAKRRGIFLCSGPEDDRGCHKLFIQDITSTNTLCPKCR